MASLRDDQFFQDPLSKEDCPICLLPMPCESGVCGVVKVYMPCCGKMLCFGCVILSEEEMDKGNLKQWCPFCRVPLPKSDEERVQQFEKRLEQYPNDGEAFYQLGFRYFKGNMGLTQNYAKAAEMYDKAVKLGSDHAHYNLGIAYLVGQGVEEDIQKAYKYLWYAAAVGGHEIARYSLGIMEEDNNEDIATKHYMVAARSGLDDSLKKVGEGYKAGRVTKDEYAKTLRAYQASVNEMKSEQRTKAESYSVDLSEGRRTVS